MITSFHTVTHSARLYLWLFITINAIVTGLVSGLGITHILLFCMSLCLLASFGFILNDIVDRKIDREVHPDRLAFADPNTMKLAYIGMWSTLLLGLGAAAYVNITALLIATSIAFGLCVYSFFLRKNLLLAPFICSFSVTSPLWAPFVVSGVPIPIFYGSIAWVMFVLIAARETILDIKDLKGDLIGPRHTIATLMGERISILTASVLMTSGCLVLIATFILRSPILSLIEVLIITVSLTVFCWLIMRPTIHLIMKRERNLQLIDSYVARTQQAMAIAPLFILVAWLAGV